MFFIVLLFVLISSMAFVSAEDVGDEGIGTDNGVFGEGLEEEHKINYHDYVNWTIEVCNYGSDNATGVYVEDVLPEGLVYYNSSQSKGSFNNITGIGQLVI